MIAPQAPLGVHADVTLPKLDPSVRFCFLHHRSNWEVILGSDGTPHLVPVVVPFRFQPGVSGVLQIGDGRAPHGDPSVALAQKEADGWIRIPEEPVVAWGQTLPSYCVRYQGQKGSAHLEAWWKLSDLGGGRVEKEWDQDGWIAWKESLVQRGIVRNISEPIRKALENEYVRAAQRRRVNPNHAVAVAHSEQYERRARACVVQPARVLVPVSEVVNPQPTEPPLWLANLNNALSSLTQEMHAMREQQAAQADQLAKQAEQLAARTQTPAAAAGKKDGAPARAGAAGKKDGAPARAAEAGKKDGASGPAAARTLVPPAQNNSPLIED